MLRDLFDPSASAGAESGSRFAAGEIAMTRTELDAALARLGLDVPEKERDELAGAAHHIAEMVARLRLPGGRNVAAEPAHVVKFPEA
jgi:hypothetical protein